MTETTIEIGLAATADGAMSMGIPSDELHQAVREAGLLADAALQLRDAVDDAALAGALRNNLRIWLAIRLDMLSPGRLPEELRLGLLQLSDFCISAIREAENRGLSASNLQALITIDLRVSAGLLEGQVRQLMGADVFELWQSNGQPEGEALVHWLHEAGHA